MRSCFRPRTTLRADAILCLLERRNLQESSSIPPMQARCSRSNGFRSDGCRFPDSYTNLRGAYGIPAGRADAIELVARSRRDVCILDHLDPPRIGRRAGGVLVVPVPPFVRFSLRVALR